MGYAPAGISQAYRQPKSKMLLEIFLAKIL
jgi:hypothetical protein